MPLSRYSSPEIVFSLLPSDQKPQLIRLACFVFSNPLKRVPANLAGQTRGINRAVLSPFFKNFADLGISHHFLTRGSDYDPPFSLWQKPFIDSNSVYGSNGPL
ncbi:MAG: hypothetical protein CM1200mP16_09650 [Nitrospina sp.]|nr:MAG: hypothetical protein CM1200mP16_09650 [Nitrospina sp.]